MSECPPTLLFVSGATPDRFTKAAAASGAGLACIDLEDSVPADGKEAARRQAMLAIAEGDFALRINPLASVHGLADIVALASGVVRPALLLLPKVEAANEIAIVRAVLPGQRIVPLIESASGMAQAMSIAAAPGVAGVMFGGGDLAAELGVELAWEPLFWARGALLMACAAAGVPAIDVPWLGLDDETGLADEARRAKAMGFGSKAAIHPCQIPAIERAFAPERELVEEARAATDAFAAGGGAAIRFRGRMLEEPIMRHYRRVLAQAEQSGSNQHA